MQLPLLFWWEGPDGSRVLTLRIWKSYDRGMNPNDSAGAHEAFAPALNHAAFFLGVGDHGGAVTREQIQQVPDFTARRDLPELRFSTLRDSFPP